MFCIVYAIMEVWWPSARTFRSWNIYFQTPQSLINQSLEVHVECKLDCYFLCIYVVCSSSYDLHAFCTTAKLCVAVKAK